MSITTFLKHRAVKGFFVNRDLPHLFFVKWEIINWYFFLHVIRTDSVSRDLTE